MKSESQMLRKKKKRKRKKQPCKGTSTLHKDTVVEYAAFLYYAVTLCFV